MSMYALAFLVALSFQADPQDPKDAKAEEKAKEEEAKKKISEFQKAMAKARPEDRPALISKLGDMQHPKILTELAAWLGKPDIEIQRRAAEEIGKYKKDPKAADYLLKAARAIKVPDAAVIFLNEVSSVEHRGVAKDLVWFYRHPNIDVCKAAVDTSGRLKSKDSISPLIDLLRELDNVREDETEGMGGGGPGPGGNIPGPKGAPKGPRGDDDKQRRKRDLTPATIDALRNITGEQKLEKAKEWQAWWTKNAKTFKEAD